MQTPIIPVQGGSTASTQQAKAIANAASADNDFQRTLTRQIEQRQAQNNVQESRALARTQAQNLAQAQAQNQVKDSGTAKPNQEASAAPERNRQEGSKPATAATPSATQQPATDGPADARQADSQASSDSAAADDSGNATAATEADSAVTGQAGSDAEALNNPVAAMLALVASYNQSTQQAAAAKTTPAGEDAATAAPGANGKKSDAATLAMLSAFQADSAKAAGTPTMTAGAAGVQGDAATVSGAQAAAGKTEPMTAASGKTALRGGTETAALQASAAADKATPATATDGKLQADAAKLASTTAEAKPAFSDALTAASGPAAAAAPLQQAALTVAQAAASVPSDKLNGRVGTPAWDQQLGQKVVWMVAGGEQSATLTLNPPDLGPMQVVLSVSNDQTSVSFQSNQPEVRQALETALPKLREMMGDAGIQLGNTSVSADSRQQNGDQQPAWAGGRGSSGGNGGDIEQSGTTTVAVRGTRGGGAPGVVDTFA